MSFQHPIFDLLGGWENVQLMLGAKQYVDSASSTSYSNRVEERELVFDFEPVSAYYKGTINIIYIKYDTNISMLSVRVTLYPPLGETPISRSTVTLRSELSHHIEEITGKTLSF